MKNISNWKEAIAVQINVRIVVNFTKMLKNPNRCFRLNVLCTRWAWAWCKWET